METKIVKDRLEKWLSFDFSTYDEKFLIRRVKKRMLYLAMTDVNAYCDLVNSNEKEKEDLAHDLAINVTNFMRDKIPFEIFLKEIMPKIIETKQIGDEIHIWSAGCASGEEPYSIAMLIFEALGRRISNYKIKITATDMSELAIRRSSAAIYDEVQFREMDPTYVEKYFKLLGDKKYEVKDHVKSLIEFKQHNLLIDKAPGKFDCVFCRNTVIYFSKESKEALFDRIYESLNPGGFFIMGKTETLMGPARDKFIAVNAPERVYKK